MEYLYSFLVAIAFISLVGCRKWHGCIRVVSNSLEARMKQCNDWLFLLSGIVFLIVKISVYILIFRGLEFVPPDYQIGAAVCLAMLLCFAEMPTREQVLDNCTRSTLWNYINKDELSDSWFSARRKLEQWDKITEERYKYLQALRSIRDFQKDTPVHHIAKSALED